MSRNTWHHEGFTLIELIVIMIMVGILAVVALPRLSSTTDFQEVAFRDQVAASLRYARTTAASHRRLVCASVSTSAVSLTIAANFGDTACALALAGPDGRTPAASSPVPGTIAVAASGTPLHFQPGGAITNSGGTVTDFTLTIGSQSTIRVHGTTGYVE